MPHALHITHVRPLKYLHLTHILRLSSLKYSTHTYEISLKLLQLTHVNLQ